MSAYLKYANIPNKFTYQINWTISILFTNISSWKCPQNLCRSAHHSWLIIHKCYRVLWCCCPTSTFNSLSSLCRKQPSLVNPSTWKSLCSLQNAWIHDHDSVRKPSQKVTTCHLRSSDAKNHIASLYHNLSFTKLQGSNCSHVGRYFAISSLPHCPTDCQNRRYFAFSRILRHRSMTCYMTHWAPTMRTHQFALYQRRIAAHTTGTGPATKVRDLMPTS